MEDIEIDSFLFQRFTFETAPVYIVMEKFMWNLMCNLIGFENGDGTFFPGIYNSYYLTLLVY